MFSRHRTKGFVIGKLDRRESDRFFLLYTQDFGRISVLGKSIRKKESKLRFGMNGFQLIEIEFIEGRTYKTLTDVRIIKDYKGIKKNLKSSSLAGKVLEDLNSLIKGEEKDLRIWSLINDAFDDFDSLTPNPLNYYYFFWNLLYLLGYGPNLYSCVSCKKKLDGKNLHFTPEEGGLSCKNCFGKSSFPVSEDVIKMLRLILEKKKKTLLRIKNQEANEKLLKNVSQKYLSFI